MAFILFTMFGFAIPRFLSVWYVHVYRPKTDADIFESVNNMLFEKAAHVELECYENTEFYNRFTLAMKDCERRFAQMELDGKYAQMFKMQAEKYILPAFE